MSPLENSYSSYQNRETDILNVNIGWYKFKLTQLFFFKTQTFLTRKSEFLNLIEVKHNEEALHKHPAHNSAWRRYRPLRMMYGTSLSPSGLSPGVQGPQVPNNNGHQRQALSQCLPIQLSYFSEENET